jgi:predicted aspartyl protease
MNKAVQPKLTPEQIGQQAFIQTVIRQRDDAQNNVAQLAGGNAVQAAQIEALQGQLAEAEAQAQALAAQAPAQPAAPAVNQE